MRWARIGGWSWQECCIASGRSRREMAAAAAVVVVVVVVGRDGFESAFPRTRAAVRNSLLGNDVGPRMMTQPGLQRTGRFGGRWRGRGRCGLLADVGRGRNSY